MNNSVVNVGLWGGGGGCEDHVADQGYITRTPTGDLGIKYHLPEQPVASTCQGKGILNLQTSRTLKQDTQLLRTLLLQALKRAKTDHIQTEEKKS